MDKILVTLNYWTKLHYKIKLPITPLLMICYSQNTPCCIPCFGKWFCAVFIQFVFIQVLPDEHARDMCLRFADMESKLGEIDRGRAIYSYCSQICDPRVCQFTPSSHLSTFASKSLVIFLQIFTWRFRWRLISGKPGKILRSAMEMRTRLERCWGSNEVSRLHTTHRSTLCPLRCWRPQQAPQALVGEVGLT